jgi:hypothetical protein
MNERFFGVLSSMIIASAAGFKRAIAVFCSNIIINVTLGMINIGELKSAITAKALVWQS